jgi:hypothetical protein
VGFPDQVLLFSPAPQALRVDGELFPHESAQKTQRIRDDPQPIFRHPPRPAAKY